jgi:flagellin
MTLSIYTNINSLTAQNNLAKSQNAVSQATARLSSGLKINSATDNAAGYAISTNFTTQIGGLGQASSNASDAINLAQTTQSALTQVTANLQAIRDLAVQSANGSYTNSDRASINTEVQQRLAEVTRIANQTDFNGQKVLDGSLGTLSFQVGANVGQTISVNVSQGVKSSQIGAVAEVSTGDISGLFSSTGNGYALAAGALTVNGTAVAAATYSTAASLAAAINTAAGSTVAAASGNELALTNNSTAGALTFGGAAAATLGLPASLAAATPGTETSAGVSAAVGTAAGSMTLAAGDLTVNGQDLAGSYATAAALASAINTAITAGVPGATGTATVSGNTITLDNSGDATNAITIGGTSAQGFSTVAASGTGAADNLSSTFTPAGVTLAAGDLVVNGTSVTGNFTSATALATAVNTAAGSTIADGTSGELVLTNTSASAVTITGTNAFGLTNLAAETPTTGASTGVAAAEATVLPAANLATEGLSINGTAVSLTGAKSLQDVADSINAANISGVSAAVSADGKGVNLYSSDTTNGLSVTDTGGLVIGANAKDNNTAATYVAGTTAVVAGSLATGTVGTVDGANDLISRIDVALNTVSNLNSTLGAIQNRFESTISTLGSQRDTLASSQSTIRDADFAAETANLSKANILQQAGISVLAQANSQPQQVLKLLQ